MPRKLYFRSPLLSGGITEELEATLHRYVWLYNQQLPQSALGSKTPLQAMKDWHKLKPKLFKKQPYYRPGCDNQGPKFQKGMKKACREVNVEIVRRTDVAKFVVLPKHWVVERTIGWLNRRRRLAKDWESLNRNALAFLRWTAIRSMLRRLCQE